MKIEVWGLGFVGLATATFLASKGHQVTGVDVNRRKVRELHAGKHRMGDAGLDAAILEHPVNYVWAVDMKESVDLVIVCVGTDPTNSSSSSLSMSDVGSVVEATRTHNRGQLVIRSTLDQAAVQAFKHLSGFDDYVVIPEFLREGHAWSDINAPHRVVVGSPKPFTKEVRTLVGDLAGSAPVMVMSVISAVIAKLSSNAYLAARVTFINAIAEVADFNGANLNDVKRAMGADPRIGSHYFQSGLGFGGYCLGKDSNALGNSFISDMVDQNQLQIDNDCEEIVNFIAESKHHGDVVVWGRGFKPGSLSERNCPATQALEYIKDHTDLDVISIDVNDFPLDRRLPELYASVVGASTLIILNNEEIYKTVQFDIIRLSMAAGRIYDVTAAITGFRIIAN